MLVDKSPLIALERALSAEPLIGHNPEGILIAGKSGFALYLLGSHIGPRASMLLRTERFRRGSEQCDAEVAQQHLLILVEQHILWFDIPMDEIALMVIVQRRRHLFDIGKADR